MEVTTLQIVWCSSSHVSRWVGDEFQFHRPLIACTLNRPFWGHENRLLSPGGTLEMIALGWMNIGAAVAPDAALASIISTVLVIAGRKALAPVSRWRFRWRRQVWRCDHYRSYHHRGIPARGGQGGTTAA